MTLEQCAHDPVLTMLHLCYYMWYPVWPSHHRSVLSSKPVLRCGGSCLGITSLQHRRRSKHMTAACDKHLPSMPSWHKKTWLVNDEIHFWHLQPCFGLVVARHVATCCHFSSFQHGVNKGNALFQSDYSTLLNCKSCQLMMSYLFIYVCILYVCIYLWWHIYL